MLIWADIVKPRPKRELVMTGNGKTTTSGYGWSHQKLRAEWKPKVATGRVLCARCKKPIIPDRSQFGDGWQLDHDPTDPTRRTYLGPSHTRCNQGGAHPDASSDPEPTAQTSW